MAQSASIQKMSHKHEAILNFMIANPLLSMKEVAANFDVTQPWLSTIVHSHAFQDQLARRKDEVFDVAILQGLDEKLTAAADSTLDAYIEKIPTLSADQLISASDKLLGRHGYGTRGGQTVINGNVTQNTQVNHVSKDVLEEARNRIGTNKVGAPSGPTALPDKSSDQGTEVEGTLVRDESELELVGPIRDAEVSAESVVPISTLWSED